MKFWTFVDRNSEGLVFVAIISLCFAFGTCGDGKGCRVRVGCTSVETGVAADGGAR